MQPDVEASSSRKRQRSISGASDSGESSPKRAASEGPSLTSDSGMRSSNSVEPQSFSHLSIIEDHDVHPSDGNLYGNFLEPPWYERSPAEKLDAFARHSQAPLEHGHLWYMVAARWLKDWQMACHGKGDKEGIREEARLGPVNNSQLVDNEGNLKPDLTDGIDYELVPKPMWDLFVQWYGPAKQTLERKVNSRSGSQELFVECYVPRFAIYRLRPGDDTTITGQGRPPTVQISLTARVCEFLDELNRLFSVTPSDVRYWRVDILTGIDVGFEYPVGLLLKSGAEPLDFSEADLNKTLSDILVSPSDEFIVEVKENGQWIVDVEHFSQDLGEQHEASPPSTPDRLAVLAEASITQTGNKEPLFKSGGFFGEMSNRLGIPQPSSTSNGKGGASSSTLQPAANIAGRGKSALSSRTPGTLGLGNLGNTCFMNSALQCLVHNEELTDYFLTELYREEMNRDNPLGMGGAIAENFGSLLTRIWSSAAGPSSYTPREFKQQLQRFAPQFSGYQQHDSQELVAFLLDGLHEDLNRVLKKPYVENPDWEGGGDKELVMLAKRSWDGYISRNDSAIVDLFQGQYKSTLVCPECQKVSITFDPFMYLTLPLPIKKKWQHDIYFIPWDTEKPHLRIPVELDYDASFKELRRILGRWTESDPNNLMTLEIFQHRFYKFLDDGLSVSDMGSHDHIVCFELPCKSYMSSKAHQLSTDDMLVLPVYCSSMKSTKSYSSQPDMIGHPFLVALTSKQASSLDSIYAAVVDRLRRWTTNATSLYKYAGVDHISDPHVVPITNGGQSFTSVTEIRENGEVIVTHTPDIEEADIADEKPVELAEEDVDMVEVISTPIPIGPQADLFTLQMCHFASTKASMESGAYVKDTIPWTDRQKYPEQPLVIPGDILLCKWDESMQTYFLNDNARWARPDFEEFVHSEYEAQRKQAEKKHDLTIEDCLDEFTKEEQLGEDDPWYCPQCKKHQQATKNLQLWKVPDVLVVHLKRFSNSRIMRDKLDAFIDFPLQGLDLESRVGERRSAKVLADLGYNVADLGLGDVNEPLLYDLFAVDEHLGGLGGGHYRAYARNHFDGEWYHFDDSHVTRSKAEDAVNHNAYLLFYRRRTTRPIGGKTHAKIQAARQTNVDKANLLPTPPEESSPPTSSQPITITAHEDLSLSTDAWTSSLPFDSISSSSSSSSPPALEEGDGPPGLNDEYFDPLEQANLRYAVQSVLNGRRGRATSPNSTSSNEAADGGSENGASPRWNNLSDFAPSPPFAKAILKPASFGPTFGDVNASWEAGQDPSSPLSRSISESDELAAAGHWESDGRRTRKEVRQLPSPRSEDLDS
ncbi:cysteine proteinase [Ramaria rubella]|nr:cysteine proteinase [Ramaria rubella]